MEPPLKPPPGEPSQMTLDQLLAYRRYAKAYEIWCQVAQVTNRDMLLSHMIESTARYLNELEIRMKRGLK